MKEQELLDEIAGVKEGMANSQDDKELYDALNETLEELEAKLEALKKNNPSPTPSVGKESNKKDKSEKGGLVQDFGSYKLYKSGKGTFYFKGEGIKELLFKSYETEALAREALANISPKAPKEPKADKAPKEPKADKAPKEPKAPEGNTPSVLAKLSAAHIRNMPKAHLSCDFRVLVASESGIVDSVIGSMKYQKGDSILYLKDGSVFTVLQKDGTVMCLHHLSEGEKAKTTIKKTDGKNLKVNKKGVAIEKAPKTAEEKQAKKTIQKAAKEQVKKQMGEGCDMAEYFKSIKGTPIEVYLWGQAHKYKNHETNLVIRRIVGTTDGALYVGKEERSQFGKLVKVINSAMGNKHQLQWFSVCSKGNETPVEYSAIEGKRVLPMFNDEKLTASLLQKIYDYPESTFVDCKTMAREYYDAIKANEGGEIPQSLKDKAEKYRNTCLTGRWREEYKKYNEQVTALAKRYKSMMPKGSIKMVEARKEVLKFMVDEYRKLGGKVSFKALNEDLDEYISE